METFNNRELATGIWLIIASLLILSTAKLRSALLDLVKTFFSIKLLMPLVVMTVYMGIVVCALNKLGFWAQHQLKNTIVWFFTAGSVTLFRVVSSRDEKKFIINSLRDNLKIIVILQFLISVYTFNLLTEFFVLPAITIIVSINEMTKKDSRYDAVNRILMTVLCLFGATLIFYTIYNLAINLDVIYKRKTLYDFVVPILLSIFLVPYIFVFSKIVKYKTAFIKLSAIIKNEKLLRYAKFKVYINFGFNLKLINRWIGTLCSRQINVRKDINDSIKGFKKKIKIEAVPPKIPLTRGWSPYLAKDFLLSEGIQTGDYNELDINSAFSCSDYIEIQNTSSQNKIAYYIDGKPDVAKSLKLVLGISDLSNTSGAYEKFLDCSKALYEKSLGKQLSDSLCKSIIEGKEATEKSNNISVTISKYDYENTPGYDIVLCVKVKALPDRQPSRVGNN